MKALVCGWFTFPGMGATAGDLLARDVVCEWLERAGCPYDVANSEAFGGADWRSIDPDRYVAVVFVCGPFGNGGVIPEFLERFAHCRRVGIDLTMLHELDEWNPFDVLWERDSDRLSRPDLVFLAPAERVPVVGVVLVRRQKEYAEGAHAEADEMIQHLISSRAATAVSIDTCLDPNQTGLRSAKEVESLIAKMDIIVTTRLHGLVLALRNEVPVVALDPIRGGAKVSRQAKTIGWPLVFQLAETTDKQLVAAFDHCQTVEARVLARECRAHAQRALAKVREEFIEEFKRNPARSREGMFR